MADLKISLITVTRNAESTIERCIRSVIDQTYKNIEYIIIDGSSTDKTIQIINKYGNYVHRFLSEPDKGIYDGMNKGIELAGGNVVGMINADDYLADNGVLADVAQAFENAEIDIVYGDLDFVNAGGVAIREWRAGTYKPGAFNWGWMPPHPTFYCKRELFSKFGCYSLDHGTAADYELMLRFMHQNHIKAFYLQKVMVKMKIGGASNKNLLSRVKAFLNDFRAMQKNGITAPFITIFFKPLRKVNQYL